MKDNTQAVLDHLKRRGVEYGDVRRMATRQERLSVKNGRVQTVQRSEDAGFGIRVIQRGAWGFASGRA